MYELLPIVLGGAWGLVATLPLLARASALAPRARAVGLARAGEPARGATLPVHDRLVCGAWASEFWCRAIRWPTMAAGPLVRVAVAIFGARRARGTRARHAAELPVVVDLLGVAVGAGCTPYVAVEVATRYAPPHLAPALARVGQACALGSSFGEALAEAARVEPALGPLVSALVESDRTGAPVAERLARLAVEERATARRAAETRARAVPVRLLFPLVFLVLPAFGLLTVVPALLVGLARA